MLENRVTIIGNNVNQHFPLGSECFTAYCSYSTTVMYAWHDTLGLSYVIVCDVMLPSITGW